MARELLVPWSRASTYCGLAGSWDGAGRWSCAAGWFMRSILAMTMRAGLAGAWIPDG
jgi:hypothetical protein